MALHPTVYAKLLGEKIQEHQVKCWLVNTGWTGGPYGAGHRMEIAYTRAMINAALRGDLDETSFEPDPVFGVQVPSACYNVPDEVLRPRNTWQDKAAYDQQAHKLAGMFAENFQQFKDMVTEDVRSAGPSAN